MIRTQKLPGATVNGSTPWPASRREEVFETMHGVRVADPYRWLERADEPAVKSWVREQDAYARRVLGALPGRDKLRQRLEALSYVDQVTAPLRRGTRYFYSQRHKDREKIVYYFREGENGEPRVLIDPNTLSADGTVSIQGVTVARNGTFAAIRVSENNRDESTIRVLNVDTGKLSDVDTIPGVQYVEPSWVPGADAFYYARLPVDASVPAAERAAHARIFLHRLGKPYQDDPLIFGPTGDPKTLIGPDVSEDGQFLFVYVVRGSVSTDVYYKSLKAKKAEFRPLFVGKPARLFAQAWGGKIYARTNEGAERWRLIRIDDPAEPSHFRELVAEDPRAVLDDFSLVGGRLALRYLDRGSALIRVHDLGGKLLRTLATPGIGLVDGLLGSPEDDVAYYSFSSFLRPETIYRTSLERGGSEVHASVELAAEPDVYPLRQVTYRSRDGTPVSMFLLEPKGFRAGVGTPFLLSGYGGFGTSLLPSFDSSLYAWLEAGGGLAFPNLRGGGEYGEAWHRAGMLTKKQNVFDDFLAAAEYLIAEGYTRADKLGIRGSSNGGLLVAAAMTQRPELFRAVVCRVPVLDMLRFQLFGSAGRWTREYGSAADPEQFKALFAYSPYHRIRGGTRYPALLLMSADSDDRVDPAHARKFAAAVQAAGDGQRPVLLRVEQRGGHGGAGLMNKQIAADADELAFLLSELGVSAEP